jgi:hypothetical protein
MDANIFFKNGDPSEPRLNAEGSFKNDFQGSFADEQQIGFVPSEEPKFNLTTDDILNKIKGTASSANDEISDLIKGQGDSKMSTSTMAIIGISIVVVFGGLGYILYKKYK